MSEPALVLWNTATRRKEPFAPRPGRPITLYVCGPTVYDRAHVGNARSAVVFDVLFRLLRHLYGPERVRYARNFTDIDDKIMARAVAENRAPQAVAAEFEAAYRADMAALGCLEPTFTPRATEHVAGPCGMIAMIEALIARGVAYVAQGHVLFEVAKDPAYGALSGRPLDEMVAGARVEVAPFKRGPADFVLWKPSRPDQPGWDSPWGRGRPGWHIECSAMIRAVLDEETIDIHGGGIDLVFPHHENECAQSRCAHGGAALARFWVHNGFLAMGEAKMSKSLGNIVTVRELLEAGWPGEAIRYALLSAHYRQPLLWSDRLLEQSRASLDRLYRKGPGAAGPSPALLDDLNTPAALTALPDGAPVLGLLADPDWFRRGIDAPAADLEAYRAARAARDWATADAIRDRLARQGIRLEVGRDGSVTWRRA
ncbi:MAG: cysteine--tRNA ligase [Sphingomonadaceae bacterium]|uniref:cysteine--tRNA ligase n=1 Tax=Thermaurantiacus sp. TaxID=2820283 RepID=UPI00298F2A8E|nr:cysteine--tRNA ligase [Thermaurantiacus sp.]MCS6987126.1 cysteine--tRNA ligase [Sphingomonadaceae bacterium]MDW8415840.1 cysteine--tRNA ligase [Thermaurantiacus sp.]